MLTIRQTDDIYLVVSAGRVEGIGSTDEQGIVVLLEENFNEIVTFILKQDSNRSEQNPRSTKARSFPQTVIRQQKDRMWGGACVRLQRETPPQSHDQVVTDVNQGRTPMSVSTVNTNMVENGNVCFFHFTEERGI